jgi:hypothetical protein
MAHPLDGALAKVARAEEHLGRLQKEIGRWREESSDRMAREHNDKRTEFRFYTDWGVVPDGTRWALLLGDGIHNLRSALDHAVYAASGPKPPPRCEFPIFLDREKFFLSDREESGGQFKYRGVRNSTVRTLIEGAQPWQRPDRPKYHLLWMLHELDIQDKHRLLTPIAMVPRELRANLTVELFQEVREQTHVSGPMSVPLQDHALILTVTTPKPAKRVKVNASVSLAIGVRVGDTDMGVQAVLGESCQATRGLIEQIRDALT